MRISMIAILNNLKITNDFTRIKYSGINLESDLTKVTGFGDSRMKEMIGHLSFQELERNHGFYWNKPLEKQGFMEANSNIEILRFKGVVQQFLMALWIISDNSINANVILGKTSSNIISKNYSPIFFSDSNGEYKISKYSRKEIDDSLEWFNTLVDINSKNHADEYSFSEIKHGKSLTHINSDKYLNYGQYDRIQRFLRFIFLARAESFLHAKITFYISALETLLTTSQTELRMQVADRTSRILGEDFEQRIKLNKIVSIAYSFRSAYIHGSVKSDRSSSRTLQFLSSVEELSNELDNILRHLTRKFLTDLRHVTEMNDEAFSIWMNELLYA